MPWNGSGTYILPPAFSPEINGTVIDADRYNGLTSDVADGITNSLNKNGENVPTVDISWGGKKITNLAAATAAGEALSYGADASVTNIWVGNTTTSAGSIGIGPTPNIGAQMSFYGDTSGGLGVAQVITGGAAQVRFALVPSAVNILNLAGAATLARPQIAVDGTDTNIGLAMLVKGTGDIYLGQTAGAAVVVNNPTGQNRNITLAGSNAGNPAIGTSAGYLNITSGTRNTASGVSTANDVAVPYSIRGSDKLAWVDSARAADERQVEFNWSSGTLVGRFVNDAYSSATNWLAVTGTSAGITSAVITGLAIPQGAITSGTYTPTLAGGFNLSVLTLIDTWHYFRVGNIVTVSGTALVTATAAGLGATLFNATLPIASDLAADYNLKGSGNKTNTGAASESVRVAGISSTNRADISWLSETTAAGTLSIMFTYQVL